MKSDGQPYGPPIVPYHHQQQQFYYHCQQRLSQAVGDDEMVTMIYSPTIPGHSPAPSVESERLMMTASYDLSGRPRFDYGGSGRRFSTSSSFRSRYSGSGGHHHHFFGGGAHRASKLSTTTVASSSTVDLRSPADVGDINVSGKKVNYAKPVDSNNNRAASRSTTVQPARWKKIVKTVINTRCTEHLLWTTSSALGVLVLVAQVPPIFLRNWVHIIEPRPINRTNDKGEIMEVPFVFNVGYFRACRWLNIANWSAIGIHEETAILEVEDNYPERCVWNPIFTGEDLSDFSFATNAIMYRFLAPPILHIVGTLFTIMAFLCSLSGHFNRDSKTLSSAIIYFIGGLGVMAGVLQVICVVDDEMYPRMKPNASGEPSTFAFHYGLSFLAAAFSFLPIQVCIYLQTSAFFSRFRNPVDKARVVPGLSKLLQQVTTIKCRTHLGKYSGLFNGNNDCRDGATAPGGGDNENDEEAAAVADRGDGRFPLSLSTSSIGGSIAGVSVNFAGRQRRESRAYSKDLSAACYGVHQEVRSVAPPLTESIVVRRPSYFQ